MTSATIYGLYSQDGRIRYVGVTSVGLKKRLAKHWHHAVTGRSCDLHNWLRSVSKEQVHIRALEEVPSEIRLQVERDWIRTLSTYSDELLNVLDTDKFRERCVGPKTDAHKKKIALARTGTHHSQEARDKMSRSHIGKPSPNDYSLIACDSCGSLYKGAVGVSVHKTRKNCGTRMETI